MKLQNLSSGQPQWTPSSQSCHAAGRLWKRSFPVAPHHDHGKPRNEWSSYFLDTTLAKAEISAKVNWQTVSGYSCFIRVCSYKGFWRYFGATKPSPAELS